LAGALWFAARFAAMQFAQLSALRDEAALLLLIVIGTIVYAESVLLLFGRGGRWCAVRGRKEPGGIRLR
jgi:putative peptidoglycan lipid II flippase